MKEYQRGAYCGGRDCARRLGQFLDPVLLLLLEQTPAHGYTLLSRMAEFGLDFLSPTVIYRALREMEDREWVSSTWDREVTQGPPRRVYALTEVGREALECCAGQLQAMQQMIEYFLALHAELGAQHRSDGKGALVHSKESKTRPEEAASMKIVIPANGTDLDAPTSSVFGRCPTFVFVDTETMEVEAYPNPALAMPGGAGVQASQFVLQHGAQAIVAPSVGPNAFRVIQAAGVPVYVLQGTTVREAVEAFKDGKLSQLGVPGTDHFGMGRGRSGWGRGF